MSECPESVSGHAHNDRSGNCAWCGRRIDPPVPMPRMPPGYRTELDTAYRQHWDPDWGAGPYDA